ncbi:MAG: hypothetical protein AAFX87_19350 [Bacteroidota bacterium]
MAILFAYFYLNNWKVLGLSNSTVVKALFYFVAIVVIINTLWSPFIDQSQEKRIPSYFHSLFYVYNYLVFGASIILTQKYGRKALVYTAYAVGTSLILQSGISILTGLGTSRDALFFNNPNQLGYYALLAGSLLIYAVRVIKINTIFQVVAYLSFLYLTLLSASKAALAGSVILVTLAVLGQGLLNWRQFIALTLAVGIGYYLITEGGAVTELFTYSTERFSTIGESGDDSIEGRGYDRIFNEPEYIFLGAGEGGYYRFDTLLKAGEIHSTFGTIIFCYGVLGFTVFFRFLAKVFKGSSLFELLYFVPIAAYSVTHQGLRSTLFWVFLAVIYLLNRYKLANQPRKIVGSKNIKNHNSPHFSKYPLKRPTQVHA